MAQAQQSVKSAERLTQENANISIWGECICVCVCTYMCAPMLTRKKSAIGGVGVNKRNRQMRSDGNPVVQDMFDSFFFRKFS